MPLRFTTRVGQATLRLGLELHHRRTVHRIMAANPGMRDIEAGEVFRRQQRNQTSLYSHLNEDQRTTLDSYLNRNIQTTVTEALQVLFQNNDNNQVIQQNDNNNNNESHVEDLDSTN